MYAQGLANYHVKVGERVELVHCRIIRVDLEEFLSKFALNFRTLCEGVKSPGRSGTLDKETEH